MKAEFNLALAMLMFTMLLPGAQVFADEPAGDNSRPASRVDVPPPPPGPYMSRALMDGPDFASRRDMPLSDDAVSSPFFKSDMPWPETRRMPKRWMPDDGYEFAPPKMPPAVMQPSYGDRGMQQPWGQLPPPGVRSAPWGRPQPAPPQRAQRPQSEQRNDAANQAPPAAGPQSGPWLPLGNYRGW